MRSTLIEALVDSLTSAFSYGYTFPAKLRAIFNLFFLWSYIEEK